MREQHTEFVTTHWLGSIDPVPIGYGFRPHLRGRLTLRGLALRRNPWTFGERVSHPLCRYSCHHSHFRYLQRRSRATFTGLRNAPLPLRRQRTGNQEPGTRSNGDDAVTPARSAAKPHAVRSTSARPLDRNRRATLSISMSAGRCSRDRDSKRSQTRISSAEPIAICRYRPNSRRSPLLAPGAFSDQTTYGL